MLLGIIAITITLAVFVLSAPMSIVLDPNKLTLWKFFGSSSLKYSQILSAENTSRRFGIWELTNLLINNFVSYKKFRIFAGEINKQKHSPQKHNYYETKSTRITNYE